MAAASASAPLLLALALASLASLAVGDNNGVYDPCSDTRIQRGDGFTFGLAFAGSNAFFSGTTQLSPCDRRLNLNSPSQLAVFRPKVDEISLLTVNTTTGFSPVSFRRRASASASAPLLLALALASLALLSVGDNNGVYDLCNDTRIQRGDGFTFGLAFAGSNAFFSGTTQLSPCDRRLILNSPSQLAVFRPKVDEISLLTVNTTTGFSPASAGGYMVAFAGRKYAARSLPVFVSNSSVTVSSFTLVLEFNKGRLQNLHWKKDGCGACSGKPNFICLGKQTCAIRTNICKNNNQGSMDCSVGIQLAFSGTDKHELVLNSWYEVSNLQQYSLYGLYSNVKGSLSGQFDKFF